ncbi:MAG: spore coat protein U domain-containing protein [Gammaproteobacteria bacterium]|nr:spore coat protein U domain-containing protein [Gammaproteobacteria bacterium]
MSAPPLAHAASIASCTATATSIAFGTYTPLQATVLASTGTITISCTGVRGRNTVTIDLSQGASGAYATRTLQAGSATLSYNLYQDAANTAIWGNGTGGSTEASATIRRRTPTATLTVYGGVLARQDPAPGTYGDTITVSVNY